MEHLFCQRYTICFLIITMMDLSPQETISKFHLRITMTKPYEMECFICTFADVITVSDCKDQSISKCNISKH